MSNPNTPFVTYEPGVPLPEKVCKKCEGRGENRFGPPEMSGREHHNPCVICHGTGKAPLRVLVEEGDWPDCGVDIPGVTWFKINAPDSLAVLLREGGGFDSANIYHGLRIRTQADVAHIADLVLLPGNKFLLVEPEEVIDLTGFLAGIGWVVVRIPREAAQHNPNEDAYSQTVEYIARFIDRRKWAKSIVNDCHELGVPVYCQELGVFEEGI